MADRIKLDIVSDLVCPWCTIGYKRLEKAISELGVQDKIDIEWHPFELNPHMPPEGQNLKEHITEKYGSGLEDQKRSEARMAEFGAELGFNFDYFDGMRIVNTRNAHILLDYARGKGKQTELKMRLVTAFFSERKDVSDRRTLIRKLQSIGLNAEEALARLDDDDSRYAVTSKENYWQSLGVSSVPTMVFNKKKCTYGSTTC